MSPEQIQIRDTVVISALSFPPETRAKFITLVIAVYVDRCAAAFPALAADEIDRNAANLVRAIRHRLLEIEVSGAETSSNTRQH